MSDLGQRMKSAADAPEKELDIAALQTRGRQIRVRRLLQTSALSLVLMAGMAWGATQVVRDGDGGQKISPIDTPDATQEHCEDKDPGDDGKSVRYCIASGSMGEGFWTWRAYINEKGELCDSFNEPNGGGGGCGLPKSSDVQLGLSSIEYSDPLLHITTPDETDAAYVETIEGERFEIALYDAPPQLEVSVKFGLYFELPQDASRVVALDGNEKVIARENLDFMITALQDDPPALHSWLVADGMIDDEQWSLSAERSQLGPVPCVSLGLGNDEKAADVEISAKWCPDSNDANELHLEQVWWKGLEPFAPVFGTVPATAESVVVEFESSAQDVEILKSPEDGMWPEPVFDTNFVVAWPPVGAEGRVIAKDADGNVMSMWDLCLQESSTRGVEYTACPDVAEFWQPKGKS